MDICALRLTVEHDSVAERFLNLPSVYFFSFVCEQT